MTAYHVEARALDAEILGVIERWHYDGAPLEEQAFCE